MQDDDFSLFKAELRGVKPIKHDRADTGKPIIDPKRMAKQREKREKAEAAHAEAQIALQTWRKQNPTAGEAAALKWADNYLVALKKNTYYSPKAADTAP